MPDFVSHRVSRIVDGRKYDTETATHVCCGARDVGRQTHLYQTRKGAYFLAYCTIWEGERDAIAPITVAEAKEFAAARLTATEFEQHFGAVEEA